jgi:hypothetical protein
MKTTKILILTFFAAISMAARCTNDNIQEYIKIINKSNKDISYRAFTNYKDTINFCSDIGSNNLIIAVRVPSDSFALFKEDDGWEYYLKGKILHIDILDRYSYLQYFLEPCDTIRKYVPVLHQYLLTLEDLERMNWTVVYPPEK